MSATARQAARRHYRAELADGMERFLVPRRRDCPWCGSAAIARHVATPDIVQRKPGWFVLERCGDCGHVFQNPRLSAAGLAFYYRDYYDGLGAKQAERMFAMMGKAYRKRAKMLRGHANPGAWLDVGTGYGHFCRTAQRIWPDTAFAGLDMGSGVLSAKQRGWITTAYQGSFLDLADHLAGRYDVVSMHHYLEHTTEPGREIDAAARVLPPGGHLLIELPDPESTSARLLGRYWSQWVQPQHLHLPPIDNLIGALAARGLTAVAVDRRRADIGHDFLLATAILVGAIGHDPWRPWAPRSPTAVDYLRWITARALMPPALLAGLFLDMTVRPLLRRASNAYRVLAVKRSRSHGRAVSAADAGANSGRG